MVLFHFFCHTFYSVVSLQSFVFFLVPDFVFSVSCGVPTFGVVFFSEFCFLLLFLPSSEISQVIISQPVLSHYSASESSF